MIVKAFLIDGREHFIVEIKRLRYVNNVLSVVEGRLLLKILKYILITEIPMALLRQSPFEIFFLHYTFSAFLTVINRNWISCLCLFCH